MEECMLKQNTSIMLMWGARSPQGSARHCPGGNGSLWSKILAAGTSAVLDETPLTVVLLKQLECGPV